jgi:FixJ family two-component response regulator
MDTTAWPEAPPIPTAPLGLTRREVKVLALVAEGQTNRQIAQALFITPKNASIPCVEDPGQAGGRGSRVAGRRSPVAGRGKAAAIAHRPGLDKG